MAPAPTPAPAADSVSAGEVLKTLPGEIGRLTAETLRWLRDDSAAALLAFGVAIGLFFAFRALRWALGRALGAGHPITTWRGFLGRIIRRTRSFFIAALAADMVSNLSGGPLVSAVDIAFTIAFAVQGAIWLREIVLGLVERRAATTEDHAAIASAMNIINVLVNVVVWVLAVILILDNIGVNVTALVAGLGVGGIAIGLAAQGIFSDLFAALSILFDRPFAVGDAISFGGNSGTVEAIGLKTTRIRALSGEQLIVSNTKLLDQQISNLRRIEERRVVLKFGIGYQTPPELLARLPEEIATIVAATPNCRFDRAHFTGFSPSSLDIETAFHVTVPDFDAMMDARHAIGIALLQRFAGLGIAFAWPTQIGYTALPDGTLIDPRERAHSVVPGEREAE